MHIASLHTKCRFNFTNITASNGYTITFKNPYLAKGIDGHEHN